MCLYFGTEPFDASGNSVARSGCASAVDAPAIKAVSTTSSVHTLLIRTATYTIRRNVSPLESAACSPDSSPPSSWRCSSFPPPRRPRRASQHIKYRYGPLTIKPGQNTISIDGDDVPRPKRSGWIVGFRPNLEYTNGKIPGVDVLHLHHAVWLINGQPTFAAGEEKTNVKLPRPFGWRHEPDDALGAQPHGPQPAPEPLPRLPHLHDRLHPRLLAAGEEDAARCVTRWVDVQGGSAYPVFDVHRGTGTNGRFTYPRDDPNAYGGGPAAQPAVHRRATACSCRPRGTCTPAGCTRT